MNDLAGPIAPTNPPFTFRRAWENGAFHQLDLIPASQFRSRLAERRMEGAPPFLSDDPLEELDRQGALRPIAFAHGPFYGSSTLPRPPADLTFREEIEFTPWAEFRWERPRITLALYSPWQLLYADAAVREGKTSLPLLTLLDDEVRDKALENWRPVFDMQHTKWRGIDDGNRQLVLTLVRLQSRYYPLVRGSSHLAFDPAIGDNVDPFERELVEFDPQNTLLELSLSPAEIQRTYEHLAFRGRFRDPNRYFYMLARLLPWSERDRFRGAARVAQDDYDACEVLRRFYLDLTGDMLPDVDERGTFPEGWKERMLGHPPDMRLDKRDLVTVLDDHGIYPHAVHLLVEGDGETDVVFPGLIAEALGPADSIGVKITNLFGGEGTHRKSYPMVEAFSAYARLTFLVGDHEGEMVRFAEQLIKRGVIQPECVQIWDKSFEEDNFTDEELVGMVRLHAEERGLTLTGVDAAALRAKVESRKEKGLPPRGLGKELLELAAHPLHGAVCMSKLELAQKALDKLLDDIQVRGWDAATEKRPILKVVKTIARAV